MALLPHRKSANPVTFTYPDGASIWMAIETSKKVGRPQWVATWPDGSLHQIKVKGKLVTKYYESPEQAASAYRESGKGSDGPKWNHWNRKIE